MRRSQTILLALALFLPAAVFAGDKGLAFHKLWTHDHSAFVGQVSEIPAYDSKTNTLWVAGVVGVDVLDADTGALIEHMT